MKTYNETIRKLTILPNWNKIHRHELSVELRVELAAVTCVFSRDQLKQLATDLPAWQGPFVQDSLDRTPFPNALLALVSVADYFTVSQKLALQLLLLDVRDGSGIAERTLNNNYRQALNVS